MAFNIYANILLIVIENRRALKCTYKSARRVKTKLISNRPKIYAFICYSAFHFRWQFA